MKVLIACEYSGIVRDAFTARVGSGRLVRHCYAVLHAKPDPYGNPRLDYFTDIITDDDLAEGKKLVRARVEYAWSGNVRRWDIVPNKTGVTDAPVTPGDVPHASRTYAGIAQAMAQQWGGDIRKG